MKTKTKILFTTLIALVLFSCNNDDDDILTECDQVVNHIERVIADESIIRVSISIGDTFISDVPFQIERPFIIVENLRYNLCQIVSYGTVNDGRMTLRF
ncbi:MAG: hypothetical protein MJA30_36645 [Cytophagales bacterium]|nr:hypothetical protein [Cytophagales bacterium]